MKSHRPPPARRKARHPRAEKSCAVLGPLADMSNAEWHEFRSCLSIIERHMGAVFEVGRALLMIRDKKLYRAEHQTFEGFCREVFAMSRAYAWRHIQAAEVMAHLLPIGNKMLPACEGQARPLIGLSPEEMRSAWNLAVDNAGGGAVTAKHVAAARERIKSRRGARRGQEAALDWQARILPLMAPLRRAVKSGDRVETIKILQKMDLLASVGHTLKLEHMHGENAKIRPRQVSAQSRPG